MLSGCMLIMAYCAAAITPLDSLRSMLLKANEDSDRAKILLNMAAIYNARNYADDEALKVSEEALQISNKHGYFISRITSYSNIALYYELKGDNEKALENFLKALDIAEKKNQKSAMANLYGNLCNFYLELHEKQ